MMKDPTTWLSAARRELDELLASSAPLTDADAWRALALMARLAYAPEGARPGAGPDRALIETWLDACAVPDPVDLVDALSDALVGDEPPEAGILDALLDIDDLAGVLCLRGDSVFAATLLEDACATISLWPERLTSLVPFARMRVATLDHAAPLRMLWDLVEGALVDAAIATQPLAGSPSDLAARVRERIARESAVVVDIRSRRRLALPTPLALAAANHSEEVRSLGTTVGGIDAWIYEDGGTVQIELALTDEARPVRGLVLVASADGVELTRVSLAIRQEGRGVFASLGASVGAQNLLRVTGARLGRDASDLEWWIEVENGN